jgi:hypothetical protein
MGFLDKAKAAAEQAVARTKEGVEDVQTKRELGQAYDELAKAAFALIESGELSHPSLEAPAAKIRELEKKLEDEGETPEPAGPAAGGEGAAEEVETPA